MNQLNTAHRGQVASTACPYGPAEILQCGKLECLIPVENHHEFAKDLFKVLTEKKLPVKERARDFTVKKLPCNTCGY